MPLELTECEKSSARILAGHRNRQLSGPLTELGRQRLREAALRNRPWQFSTGPRSPDGKARAALNGHRHQANPHSRRQLRAGLAEFAGLMNQMASLRRQLIKQRLE